jgi:ribosomal protein S12
MGHIFNSFISHKTLLIRRKRHSLAKNMNSPCFYASPFTNGIILHHHKN